MKRFISNLFRLSVTRVEILTYAKKRANRYPGLCFLICDSLWDYEIKSGYTGLEIAYYFPLYTPKNAVQFGTTHYNGYWWPSGKWNTGRMDFLDWLIEQYKDDKTNLRKL